MWIKICANTCVEDALTAAEDGADAVGFVFAPSRRQVTAEQVRPMTAALPHAVERVGVFAGQTEREIAHTAALAGLTAVQLHGGLDLAFADRLRAVLGPEIGLIHTVHWDVGDEAAALHVAACLQQARELPAADRLLLDARVGKASGGLGVGYDWTAAAKVLDRAAENGAAGDGVNRRIIVAGGLNAANVREAIGAMQPYGVDVASGVEREPGRKDREQVRAFIRNARSAG